MVEDKTRREMLYGIAGLTGISGVQSQMGQVRNPQNHPEPQTEGEEPCDRTENNGEEPEEDQEQEDEEEPEQQSSDLMLEERNRFNLLIDPDELYNEGAVSGENGELPETEFEIFEIKRALEITEGYINQRVREDELADELSDIYVPQNSDYENIEIQVSNKGGPETFIYDESIGEDDITASLEDDGFETTSTEFDKRGWQIYSGQDENSTDHLVAVKDRYAIFMPRLESTEQHERALEIAVETYEGERDTYPENPEDFGEETLNTIIEYIEEENPTALEDGHNFEGNIEYSEMPDLDDDVEVGNIETTRYANNEIRNQNDHIANLPAGSDEIEMETII